MSNLLLVMAALSALALGHCMFLAVFFLQREGKYRLSNILLGGLLLVLALRIFKAAMITLVPKGTLAVLFFSGVGMAMIGPLLWLYLQSYLLSGFKWKQKHLLHFIFPCLALLMIPLLTHEQLFTVYYMIEAQWLCYLLFSMFWLIKSSFYNDLQQPVRQWLWLLIASNGLIWLVFAYNMLNKTLFVGLTTTLISTIILYGLSFWVMRHPIVLSGNGNLRKQEDTDEALQDLAKQIQQLFQQEKTFTDSNLTIAKVADRLKAQPYIVSKSINCTFQKTFPEFLNGFRIAEAAELLQSAQHQHLSIEAIAYESGFNSLSAFYTAFKKIHQLTPAEYRKRSSKLATT